MLHTLNLYPANVENRVSS